MMHIKQQLVIHTGNASESVTEQFMRFFSAGGGLYAIVTYSPSYKADRIRRIHKRSLAKIERLIGPHCDYVVIIPDGYRVDTDALSAQVKQHLTPVSHIAAPLDFEAGRVHVVVDRMLAECEGVSFFVEKQHKVTTLERLDLDRLMKPQFLQFAVRDGAEQYRAKLERVSPLSLAPRLREHARCYLGVSLENENFDRDELLGPTLEWIAKNFKQCQIVIGDYIHRLTLQIKNPDLPDQDALAQAVAIGRRFMDDKRHLVESFGRNCTFEYLPMSKAVDQRQYRDQLEIVQRFAAESAPYLREVERFADMFISRQEIKRRDTPASNEQFQRAISYLIEETAFCAQRASAGWPLLVYPGPIDPFMAVSEGEIPDAPDSMRQIQMVSLKFKRVWLPGERAQARSAVPAAPQGKTAIR